jgi:Holliday junction resolvase RusA-like endonuclease
MTGQAVTVLSELPQARVYGDPRPQGSKRAFATKNGKAVLLESSDEGLKTWRNRLATAVQATRPKTGPIEGPVGLAITFWLRRPQRPKHRAAPAGRPDLSKLIRAAEDELTGVWVYDDSQFCRVADGEAVGDRRRSTRRAHLTVRGHRQCLARPASWHGDGRPLAVTAHRVGRPAYGAGSAYLPMHGYIGPPLDRLEWGIQSVKAVDLR